MASVSFLRLITAFVLVTASLVSLAASNASYNHVGVQYVDQNLDDFDCSQDGLNLYGNLDIDGAWFGRAAITEVSGNRGCGSTTVSAGGGYRTLFNDTFDMYGTLSFESTSPDAGGSDSGMVLAAGLRGFIGDDLEGRLEFAHHAIFDGTTAVNAGVAYWFSPRFSATVDLSFSADTTSMGFGARMNF